MAEEFLEYDVTVKLETKSFIMFSYVRIIFSGPKIYFDVLGITSW